MDDSQKTASSREVGGEVGQRGHRDVQFPWENLAFEGGGAKGYAYIGAIQCLEEAGIYPGRIRRVAGTSIGSLFATLVALGCSTDYMVSIVPSDFQAIAKDGSGGRVRSFVRAARARGMHPGQRLYDFLGQVLTDKAGNPDITFAQLYEKFGRELCIPVTNVTRMMTEYCHVKTTPNMSVRLAARTSMSLPVLLQPVEMASGRSSREGEVGDVYVDGGLLCNNPTHAFDGWWLSMRKENTFLRRVQPLSKASEQYPRSARFSPPNDRTLGFTLFSESEADITRGWVSSALRMPARPGTPAATRRELEEESRRELSSIHEPIQRLVTFLDDVDSNEDGRIDIGELQAAIERSGVTEAELVQAFGSADPRIIFAHVDTDDDDTIDFNEILEFLESIGIDVTTQLVGFPARHPRTVLDFALNMLEAVSRDLTRANFHSIDRDRTVPINTDYVGTTTFDLEREDLQFLIQTGRDHTRSFLDEWTRLQRP